MGPGPTGSDGNIRGPLAGPKLMKNKDGRQHCPIPLT